MSELLNNIYSYILIVDDEKDDHFFLRKALANVVPHAIIESIYDGTGALEYLNNCAAMPNLIFLDLNMPKLSGKETIKVIRQNDALKNVPVIILTTSKNEIEKNELMKLGANAFYTKPNSPSELLEIVTEVRDTWLQPQ